MSNNIIKNEVNEMFHNWMWGGGIWFGWVVWLFLIAIIIWLLISQSNRYRDQLRMNQHPESPIDIIKKRYARGEITKEQFEQMKKDLEK